MILIFYCDKIRTKFAILTIVGVSDIYYIHSAVQPSPLAIPRTFSSPQTETPYMLNIHSPLSLPQPLTFQVLFWNPHLVEDRQSASAFNILSATAKCCEKKRGWGAITDDQDRPLQEKTFFPKEGHELKELAVQNPY